MFTDTLIESQSSPQLRPRLAATLSMVFQAGVLGALILVPLLYPGALESFSFTPPVPLTTPMPVHEVVEHTISHPTSSTIAPTVSTVIVRHEGSLRFGHPRPDAGATDIPPNTTDVYVPGLAPTGPNIAWLTARPSVQLAKPQRVVISSLDQGLLVHRVEPRYPDVAKAAHIQGDVVIEAVISRTGEITGLQVLSGHPMLVAAAVDAVKQWRYRPYKLNGEAVEVETQVTVRFRLGS